MILGRYKEIHNGLRPYIRPSFRIRPVRYLPEFLRSLELKGDAQEEVFAALMEYRYFTPRDACEPMLQLFAAQLLNGAEKVVLNSWALLPAAVASGASEVWLPQCDGSDRDRGEIASALAAKLPQTSWQPGKAPDGLPVLGAALTPASPLGVLILPWRILENRKNMHGRSLLLRNVRSILQFPKSRWMELAQAVVQLGGEEDAPIRMARTSFATSLLDDVALLTGPPGADAVDVERSELRRSDDLCLLPQKWIAPPKTAHEGIPLRELAIVLRCQLPKKELDVEIDECNFGSSDDGFIACEVALANLDSDTGLLSESAGQPVRINLDKEGESGKYLLQSGDSLFCFRGTSESVGRMGFVGKEVTNCVPNRSLYIVRAKEKSDAIWLHYALKKAWQIKARTLETGSRLQSLSIETLRDLRLQEYTEVEKKSISDLHCDIVRCANLIQAQKNAIRIAQEEIRLRMLRPEDKR